MPYMGHTYRKVKCVDDTLLYNSSVEDAYLLANIQLRDMFQEESDAQA